MNSVNASKIDELFDAGEDVLGFFDLSKANVKQRDTTIRRVNVDMPKWMIDELDQEAERIAISRQALIKTWLAERLDAKPT